MQVKRKYYFLITFVFVILGYVLFKLLQQKKVDNDYICNCQNGLNMSSELILKTYYNKENIENMIINLNELRRQIDRKSIVKRDAFSEYKYQNGFELEDTLTFEINDRKYRIYGFKYDTIIINKKKGLECEFKGAYLDGKWIEGKIFFLE